MAKSHRHSYRLGCYRELVSTHLSKTSEKAEIVGLDPKITSLEKLNNFELISDPVKSCQTMMKMQMSLDTEASVAISSVAATAGTIERTNFVIAYCIYITVVKTFLAFINIYED